MDHIAYLRRIGYQGSLAPTAETLRELHCAHMLAVPFENLDIHLGRPIVLEQGALFDKIVRRRRGGFCYELNGLFAALLHKLGFDVTMLSAGVARADGSYGPEFDHLTLLVTCPNTPGDASTTAETVEQVRWLADVGFGDSFREPLRLDDTDEQVQDSSAYRLDRKDEYMILLRHTGQLWEPQYRFTLKSHTHDEFAGMCHYHQSSPQSSFTQKRVCSMASRDGRLTLSDRLLIITERGERTERMLADEQEYQAILGDRFGIDLALEAGRSVADH
jgi:N-hydroxyarylamine O-acetyltransferase